MRKHGDHQQQAERILAMLDQCLTNIREEGLQCRANANVEGKQLQVAGLDTCESLDLHAKMGRNGCANIYVVSSYTLLKFWKA